MNDFFFVLESYVDDIFGGANTYAEALHLRDELISVGKLTTAIMNPKKCKGPSKQMVILGFLYDAATRHMSSTKEAAEIPKPCSLAPHQQTYAPL